MEKEVEINGDLCFEKVKMKQILYERVLTLFLILPKFETGLIVVFIHNKCLASNIEHSVQL